MEGSTQASSEKIPVQNVVTGQISDSGEGDMCSSEYSMVSDSRAFTEQVTIQSSDLQQSDLDTSHLQTDNAALTTSGEELVKTELLSEDFDMTSIPPAVEQTQSIVVDEEEKDLISETVGDNVKREGEGKDNRENGEESFEVISKGDVDDINTKENTHADRNVQKPGLEPSTKQETDDENWVFILGHEKLKKKVIKAGDGQFTRPVYSQVVRVRCHGKLRDGTVVDDCDNLQLTIGDGDVIQALDLCLPMMELNEISIIETDAKYAYGDKGRDADIPPGAHITYEVELKTIEDQPDFETLPLKERIMAGSKKRERGNWWYSRTEYSSAINSYNKALAILNEQCGKEDSPEDVKGLIEERVKCHNNLGAAQLKVEAWLAAIKSCDAVLKHQPENVKALFRKGKCLAGNGDIESAIAVLRQSLKIEPESKLIHSELSRLVTKQKVESQSAKEMYQRMLGGDRAPASEQEEQGSAWKWYVGGAALAALASAGIAAYKYM